MAPNIRQHKVYPEEFPESWASGWGEDEYGIWMEFDYKGVVQRFRWCEPGTFLMGSPDSEFGRYEDEIQHMVTLSNGFWIGDTAVTQSLWKVVMGSNPSYFIGNDKPVEQVSWEDSQLFIAEMNRIQPKLNLSLPSEAQWEYACRAGSSAPFFWGNQIDSIFVNFDGNYPYIDGKQSDYRKETISTQSFTCNSWGLFQMHGNIFEWCKEWYNDYSSEPVIDPVSSAVGNIRVLRGGAWISTAKDCRSAYRNGYGPSDRLNRVGFRLVRSN